MRRVLAVLFVLFLYLVSLATVLSFTYMHPIIDLPGSLSALTELIPVFVMEVIFLQPIILLFLGLIENGDE
jgi:hypothetical protein